MEIENLGLESYFYERGIRWVAGVDEAGRGPLAGPVVAAACLVSSGVKFQGVRDSKALSPRVRKKVFWNVITQGMVAIGVADEAEIDRLNILRASLLAMRRAVLALPVTPDLLLIDGNFKIDLPLDQVAIVRGDARVLSIAAASVAAKVTRDEMMLRYDAQYPQYGFRIHKGYPTRAHRDALEMWGPSPIHRMSFRPVEEASAARVQRSVVTRTH